MPDQAASSPKTPAALPVPTTEQRAAIRNLLDHHFDDGIGRFLDGMSDQKIAEKLGLPAVHVKTIREAAYGPEKADPELVNHQTEVERLSRDLASVKARLEKALGTVI